MATTYQDIEVQQFIGFVQYVRKFIRNFSEMANPLIYLIRGAQMFKWTTREFDKLKDVACSQLMLQLPNFMKPFEIQTNASNQAYGAVLFQEGHPIAYESKNISEVESRWPTHEKEMLAIVYALPGNGGNVRYNQ